MKKSSLLLLMLAGLSAVWRLPAQESSLTPVTRTFALKNVNIVVRPGEVISMGTVVVKDGLIQAVGKNVAIPYDAKVLDTDSMYVYAGFIDGLSYVAQKRADAQESEGRRQQRPANPGNPSNEAAGIQPERRMVDLLSPQERSVEEWRKLGFTAAHVVPQGGMLPGYGALILLAGDSPDAMLLRDQSALFTQLAGARGVYPSTIIAVMSKWRELYEQAKQAKAHEALYAKDPNGVARPAYDKSLHAFYPVIDGKMPVFFLAEDVKTAYRAFTMQADLGFPLVLAGLKEGWHVTNLIKAKKTPVFLNLELPEPPKKEKEKKEGEAEKAAASAEKTQLEQRRAEQQKLLESQAVVMEKNGIPFGFASVDTKSKDVQANLRRMIAAGLSEQTALAALTTVPADMLGLSKVMGTVEKGKMANLVVTSKPYFDEKANVRFVLVDGRLFEYTAPAPKKAGDPNVVVSVKGRWSYDIDAGGATMGGTITLVDNGGAITGTVTNPQTGQATDIQGASLSGNTLSFSTSFDGGGQTINVDWTLVIDGESFDGSVSAGQMGTFPIEGKRIGNPN